MKDIQKGLVKYIYSNTYLYIPRMLGKLSLKVILFFTFVLLLARFPVMYSADIFVLFFTIGFIAILLFVFPWKKFDELGVNDG